MEREAKRHLALGIGHTPHTPLAPQPPPLDRDNHDVVLSVQVQRGAASFVWCCLFQPRPHRRHHHRSPIPIITVRPVRPTQHTTTPLLPLLRQHRRHALHAVCEGEG